MGFLKLYPLRTPSAKTIYGGRIYGKKGKKGTELFFTGQRIINVRMAEPDTPPERLRLGVLAKCGSLNKANGLPLSEGRPVNLTFARRYQPKSKQESNGKVFKIN